MKLIPVILVIFIASCSLEQMGNAIHDMCGGMDSIPARFSDFRGEWESDHSEISFGYDGSVHYKSQVANASQEMNVFLEKIDSAEIKISCGAIKKSFTIDEFPHETEGKWEMKLNGTGYQRK
jgi:hypothetical protein